MEFSFNAINLVYVCINFSYTQLKKKEVRKIKHNSEARKHNQQHKEKRRKKATTSILHAAPNNKTKLESTNPSKFPSNNNPLFPRHTKKETRKKGGKAKGWVEEGRDSEEQNTQKRSTKKKLTSYNNRARRPPEVVVGGVHSSFGSAGGCSAAASAFGSAVFSVAVPLSSFETSMSEVQRVRLSRSNCYSSAPTKKNPRGDSEEW